MKYGFSGLNSNLNSSIGNAFNTNTNSQLGGLIIPARVTYIMLDNSDPVKFEEYGGWNGLGVIEYELVNNPAFSTNKLIAYPLNPNIKNYPLINEVVYVLSLPNTLIGENNTNSISYYINIVSLWNHPHHNAYPSRANEPTPPQQKDYIETQAGSARIVTNESKEIFLGKTFKERSNIHPLLPFEGDIIHEGRWGNSIRLGSTVKNGSNNWSDAGIEGDPITIIRNGQGDQTEEGWIPIVENINNDNSSIYLTSNQNVPLLASSINYTSYTDSKPTTPNRYTGNQIILNSGRLVFNTNNDHILLSSAKSINLNSQESVNIDTKKFITQADKIFLGKEDLAAEPLLLGNTTVQVLKDLTSAVKQLTNILSILESDPVAQNSPATFSTLDGKGLAVLTSPIRMLLEGLEVQIGISPENSTLTSKRNFTL